MNENIQALRRIAATTHEHSRKCKKPPFECESCTRTIKWFGEMPSDVLSQVLEEK